jgi:hypothetical protein
MRRNQNRPQNRYVPYAPMIGPPIPGRLVPVPPPNLRVLHPPVLIPSPYNPHHRLIRPVPFNPVVPPYCPPFPSFSTPNELLTTTAIQSRTVRNNRPLEAVSKKKVTPVCGKIGSTMVKKSRKDYEPVTNVAKRTKLGPPPPPPLSQLFTEHDNKSAMPNDPKTVCSTAKDKLHEYRSPASPEEERLKLHIISVVKKLLKNKKLDKRMFKFICRHCSSNLFSILSAKKDISKPEKMIQVRMAKIAKLVDEECDKIVEREKTIRGIPLVVIDR